jgi:hypothetical protein
MPKDERRALKAWVRRHAAEIVCETMTLTFVRRRSSTGRCARQQAKLV